MRLFSAFFAALPIVAFMGAACAQNATPVLPSPVVILLNGGFRFFGKTVPATRRRAQITGTGRPRDPALAH